MTRSVPSVRWEKVNVVGGKVFDQRLAGHVAVYHKVGCLFSFRAHVCVCVCGCVCPVGVCVSFVGVSVCVL